MTPGPLLFARYAYPPNALGYCGPEDSQGLLEHADARVSNAGLVELARGFEGAWPYLELIAGANGIKDPLDPRVVDAYWIGNSLLERVGMRSLGNHLDERFRKIAGRAWAPLTESIPAGGVPHHSFHVLCVYPWVGFMRAGPAAPALHVLDRCRIRWGQVLEIDNENAVVRFQPLCWDGIQLRLGPETVETAIASKNSLGFVRDLRAGDWVSLHWGWICDRITPDQCNALRAFTDRHLAIVNQNDRFKETQLL